MTGIGVDTYSILIETGGVLDRKHTTYHWENRPTVDWDSFKDGCPELQEGTVCYTEGSQTELEDGSLSDVGFGFVIQNTDGNTTKIWGNIGKATVFQVEAFAIHKAAKVLLEYEPTPVHFYVDCQSVIIDVCGIECNTLTIFQCKQMLEQLCATRSVTFHWVKAHVGHDLNEEADRLAKLGTTSHWTYSVPLAWCQVCLLYTSPSPRDRG